MKTKIRIIGALAVASLWLVLCLCAWFKQPDHFAGQLHGGL